MKFDMYKGAYEFDVKCYIYNFLYELYSWLIM